MLADIESILIIMDPLVGPTSNQNKLSLAHFPPQQGAAATISPKREQVMSVEVPGPMRLPNGMNGNFDSIYTACTEITVALPQEQPNFTSQPLSSRRKAYTGRPRGPAAPTGHSEFGKQHGTG